MASKRENKIALAKARREKAFSKPKDTRPSANRFARYVRPGGSVGQDIIGGTSGPISEATGFGDLVNRLGRNYTVDVGDAVSRIGQDTFMGGKGKSGLQDNTLIGGLPTWANAIPNVGLLNYGLGNLINNSDATQTLAPGDAVGAGGLAKLGLRVATSKGGKAAIAGLLAGEASGLRDSEEAQASPAKAIKIAADRAAGLTRGLKFEYPEVQDATFDWLLSNERGLTPAAERIASRFSIPPVGQSIKDRVTGLEDPVKYARWVRSVSDREIRSLRNRFPNLAGLSKQELIDGGYLTPVTSQDLMVGIEKYAPMAQDVVSSLGIPVGAVERPVLQHLTALAEGGPLLPSNRAVGGNFGNWVQGSTNRPQILKIISDAGEQYGLRKSRARDIAEGIMSIAQ